MAKLTTTWRNRKGMLHRVNQIGMGGTVVTIFANNVTQSVPLTPPPITIIFNHSTCKIYSPLPPNSLSHSGFRHGVQDLIIWSNADMNEYGKTDVLTNIFQTKKLWDQEMKQVTPLSANMKFIVGIFHTGRIRRMMIQRHSRPSSTPPKRIQGNLKGSKPKIESDY